jgi:hypothetical protein
VRARNRPLPCTFAGCTGRTARRQIRLTPSRRVVAQL